MGEGTEIDYTAVEKFLRDTGERERDEVRPLLTNPTVDYATRRHVWGIMDEATVFLQGFLFCILLLDSEEKAEYYREFFEQARSRKGLEGDET